MKKLTAIALVMLCFGIARLAALQLTWSAPPGYSATLYVSTNLSGGVWTPWVERAGSPVAVEPTNGSAFFYVALQQTNRTLYFFTNDFGPNAEGLIPDDINSPSVSYRGLDGRIAVWDTNSYTWKE